MASKNSTEVHNSIYGCGFIHVYDPGEKKVIITCYNHTDVESKLGIPLTNVLYALKNKNRTYSKVLKMDVAIRYAKKEVNDKGTISKQDNSIPDQYLSRILSTSDT